MIEPAQKYMCRIRELFLDTFYNMDYMYYYDASGWYVPEITTNEMCNHQFAIVDKDGEVVGFVHYFLDFTAGAVSDLGMISFKKSTCFGWDLLKIIDNIFNKYNMNKIVFRCFDGNPALKHYYKFIDTYGGRIVGTLRKNRLLSDGKLHDEIIFEIFKKDYNAHKHYRKIH